VGDNEAMSAPGTDLKSGLQASCTCKQVVVSSLGEAQHIQPGNYSDRYNYYLRALSWKWERVLRWTWIAMDRVSSWIAVDMDRNGQGLQLDCSGHGL
jgi:hypothetical protein